jgi:acetyl esterase/lipase
MEPAMNMLRASATVLSLLLVCGARAAVAQSSPILLWPSGAPGSEGKVAQDDVVVIPSGEHIVRLVDKPSGTIYLPDGSKNTGALVVVLPGGGHRELWVDHEGAHVAEWLNTRGIAAFVVRYRLARAPGSTYTIEGDELADAQRALRLVRSRSSEWGIDPNRVGILGFSAGGAVAALAGTRYDAGNPSAPDVIDRQSSRPSFTALIYPGLTDNLKWTKDSPPVFLLAGENDSAPVISGSAGVFAAVKQAGGSAELHFLAGAGHGFGVRDSNPHALADWTSVLYDWIDSRGFVARR